MVALVSEKYNVFKDQFIFVLSYRHIDPAVAIKTYSLMVGDAITECLDFLKFVEYGPLP